MKKAFKIFVLVFLLASQVVFAQSDSEKAQSTFEKANVFAKQGNHKLAIEYFQKSYVYEAADGTAYNLGLDYEAIKDYSNALKWYKKSFKLGKVEGGVNAGYLYETQYKNYQKAIKWYKKAISKGNLDAYNNIAILYHDIKKDNVTASAYYLATIGRSYSRKVMLNFLRNNWKINEKTLLKAYILQKKLIPNPYLDPEFEAKIPAPHRNRRGIGR